MNKIELKIREHILRAIKGNTPEMRDNLKCILGEFQRGAKKSITEDEAIKILKKLEKLEKETLKLISKETSSFLTTVQLFLPKSTTEKELITWIEDNVDFSILRNKMQAVGMTIKAFPSGSVDGNMLKKIIQERF